MRLSAALIWSATFLSSTGLICAGTLSFAPATDRLVSPRFTLPLRLGSIRQLAANFGRAVTVTLPLISAEALTALMLMLPICLATLPPSSPPMASPTAPVALAASEPVTFSFPFSAVVSDSTSWPPVAPIDPREAVQPMSAFCSTCDTGLSALPEKLRGVPRSAASRIAVMGMVTWARITELRGAGGSGGRSARAGREPAPRGENQSIAFRLTKNETATTAIASRMVLSRIVPPGLIQIGSL